MTNKVYWGRVSHQRFLPKQHRFRYRVIMFHLFLDDIDQTIDDHWGLRGEGLVGERARKRSWRNALPFRYTLRRSDFLPNYSGSLDAAARLAYKEETGEDAPGRIAMLTNLRSLNWNFNPITIYFFYQGDAVVRAIAEVTNTPWGERHLYVLNAPGTTRFAKAHHVSPFLTMDGLYELTYEEPGEQFSLEMSLHDSNESDPSDLGRKRLTASMALQGEELSDASLHAVAGKFPDMAFRVSLYIYIEAAKLILKGIKYVPHPGQKKQGE